MFGLFKKEEFSNMPAGCYRPTSQTLTHFLSGSQREA
jgi:hypothetical protein